jgi:hypothetical protein
MKGNEMKRNFIILLFCVAVVLIFTIHAPGNDQGSKNKEGSELQFSKKIHRVLTAEMNALQNGMTNLAIAIPAGRSKEIAEIAKKMRDGYIMKEILSKKQLKEFHSSLPSGYTEIDHEFRTITDSLMRAAQGNNRERVNLYFYKLIENCVTCHAKYAKKRFPDFNM